MDGWISLHRKIRKNPIFNDMELLRLWLICLTEATHKQREQIIGRQTVHLEPGEFVTGRFDLQEMYNDGLKRDQQISPKTASRWLETLKNGEFLTIKVTNKFSVVSILNWDKYQSSDHEFDQQVTNKRPTSDQQVTTNNNVNKSIKKKKELVLKDIYAEKVTLTKAEYEKLIIKYGSEEVAKAAIEKLSNYKCSKPNKYTSDYHVLIGWVYDDFVKRKLIVLKGGQANGRTETGNTGSVTSNQPPSLTARFAQGIGG
jgi:TusA-related sulfurtransferase